MTGLRPNFRGSWITIPAFAVVMFLAISLAAPRSGAADVLDEIRKEKRLLWGGDQEGGGPYIFPRDDRPAEVTGFEVELANRLAEYLKVRAEFSQGQWDRQPDLLRTRKIHVILNGYEFTPERAEFMDSSIPYYIYDLNCWRERTTPASPWEDLKRNGRRETQDWRADSFRCGYLRDEFPRQRLRVSLRRSTDAMREVETWLLPRCRMARSPPTAPAFESSEGRRACGGLYAVCPQRRTALVERSTKASS
jgi:polar amino acid transport system substrate-binding protein